MCFPTKWIYGSIGLCLLGGCALWQEANAPLVPAGGVQEAQVQLVAQKPAADYRVMLGFSRPYPFRRSSLRNSRAKITESIPNAAKISIGRV